MENRNKIIYVILAVSIICNVLLLGILLGKNSNSNNDSNKEEQVQNNIEQIKDKAKVKIKEYVCSNLYIPESYDPVETTVDSAFYSYLTDYDCLKAAEELIDLRRDYNNAQSNYDEAVNNIRTFGGSGVFRHFSVERDEAKKTIEETKPKIEKCESTIKNRDTSHDGQFIGWFVYNRYRAKTNSNIVSFGEALLLFDKNMDKWNLRYNIEKDSKGNLDELKSIMEELLNDK